MSEYGTGSYIPQGKIDCQTLLANPKSSYSGWLRKHSFRNKLKIFHWPQVYVVLSGGCIYYYGSEMAKKSHSFSLFGYNSILRDSEVQDALFVFKIIHTHAEFKTYYFSASSEQEMKEWMRTIKREMNMANNTPTRGKADGSDNASNDSGYLAIEEKIYDDPDTLILPQNYKNKRNSEADSDDDMDGRAPPPIPPRTERSRRKISDKGNYKLSPSGSVLQNREQLQAEFTERLQVQESEGAQNLQERRSRGDGASISKKEVKEEEPVSQETYWSSIYFEQGETSNENITEILRKIAEDGVYLVKQCPDGTFTLCFFAKNTPRKLKIKQKDDTYFITPAYKAASVEELVYYYYEHDISLQGGLCARLETPYKLHPKYSTL